ncbi:MAG: DNA gyrase inhibitor YacG [Pseudomonadota bacterium]
MTASPAAPAKSPRCPICGKPVVRAYRPFCSKRCADVDLGRWLSDAYRVPGETASPRPEDD